MKEKILPYPCKCGGKLKKSRCGVEFFGLFFGIKECEVCEKCGAEYLDDKTLAEIEKEIKKKRLYGLEQRVSITKSGNSLVIRIPPEIAKFADIKYKNLASIFPVTKKRIEIELLG